MSEPFDAARHLDAMASTMGLTITPSQRPGVERYLAVAHLMATVVASAPIGADGFELAPVFRPGEADAGEGGGA